MTAQQQLLAKYGPPNAAYVRAHCSIWDVKSDFSWFPVSHFLVNNDFKILLQAAFRALEANGHWREIHTFDGCYNDRSVRGSGATSLHAWAAAIDLNASVDGMVVNPTPEQRKGTWSDEFIITMKGAGLFYGGDFHTRADPMHWGMFNG